MGQKNKYPLADWTGPQIDKSSLESVLDKYFEGLHGEAPSAHEETRRAAPDNFVIEHPTANPEARKIQKSSSSKQVINNEVEKLTGSLTGSKNQSSNTTNLPPIYLRLDATHTISESVLYSVMYRETHSKGSRTRRFSIPELMKLSGIRSKNTVRRALAGLKEKLSIKELTPVQATLPPLYEIRKIREIFADRSEAGIEIDDRKIVFHRTEQLTGSKIDPLPPQLTGSKIDPHLKILREKKRVREDDPASPAVENAITQREEKDPSPPLIAIFADVLNRGLKDEEQERLISEMIEILREWAIAKSIHAREPIREVTYFLNGLRQALTPKQAAKDIEPEKMRRWIIRLLKDRWPTSNERAQVEIGEAAEYIKQCLANHRINYGPQVSLISAIVGEWYQGVFD